MHPAIAIANYFIEKAEAGKTPVNGAQLHCLSYFAHGLRLALVNLPLLDEAVLADKDGVTLAGINRTGIGTNRNVTRLLTQLQTQPNGLLDEVAPVLDERDPAVPTLDIVWARFSSFSAYDLGVFVRGQGGPWDQTWNDPQRLEGLLVQSMTQVWQPSSDSSDAAVVIANSLIRRWFRKLVIQENRDQAAADGLERTVMVGRHRLEETASLTPQRNLRAT